MQKQTRRPTSMDQFELGKIYPAYIYNKPHQKMCKVIMLYTISVGDIRTEDKRAVLIRGDRYDFVDIRNRNGKWKFAVSRKFHQSSSTNGTIRMVTGANPRHITEDMYYLRSELTKDLMFWAQTEKNLLTMMEIRKSMVAIMGEQQAQLILDAIL